MPSEILIALCNQTPQFFKLSEAAKVFVVNAGGR